MTSILGLPLHPLVVHAAVIVIPVAALAPLLLVRPSWRRVGAPIVALLGVVALGTAIVARSTGQAFEDVEDPDNPAFDRHEELGEQLWAWVLLVVVLAIVTALLARRRTGGPLLVGAIVLTIVAGLAATTMTVLTGHAGSESVWGDALDERAQDEDDEDEDEDSSGPG